MKLKRYAFLVLLVCFAGYVLWRMLWFPYDPERLYRSLPPDAVFLSEHDGLAARWSALLGHPLAAAVGGAAGAAPEVPAELATDAGTRAIVKRFGGRKTLLAYAPAFGPTRRPAWLLVSWGGVQAQLARWGFYAPVLRDFERVRLPNRRLGWLLKSDPKRPAAPRLSLAVAQGVLFACYSDDPQGVAPLMDRMERARDTTVVRDRLAGGRDLHPGHDRGWVQSAYAWDARLAPGWRFALQLEDGNRVRLWLGGALTPWMPAGWSMPAPAEAGVAEAVRGDLARMLGGLPAGLTVVPFAYAEAALQAARGSLWERVVRDCLAAYDPGITHVVVAPVTTAHGGRLMGMRTPAVLAGFRTASPPEARRLLSVWLDRINAHTQLGLIAKVQDADPARILADLDAVRFPALSAMAAQEKPAVLVMGSWVLVASHRGLLEQIPAFDAGSGPPVGVTWEADSAAGPPGSEGFLWADVEALSQVYNNFLGIYDILNYRPFQGRRTTPERRRLELVRNDIEACRPLRRLRAWVRSDGGQTEVTVLAGGEE